MRVVVARGNAPDREPEGIELSLIPLENQKTTINNGVTGQRPATAVTADCYIVAA